MRWCLGRVCGGWPVVLVAALVAVAITWVGSDRALAAVDCGSTSGLPTATEETSFSSLQSAVQGLGSGQSGTYYLSGGTITAPSGQNLALPSNVTVTIDLDGCGLSITNPIAQDAAIEVPSNSTLTIEDTSPNEDGDLQVTGAAGGTDDGGGAGIGGNGGAGSSGGGSGTVMIESGTVNATGGVGAHDAGGGAGIGGGGSGYGSSGYTGGASASVTIEGGTVSGIGGAGGYSGGGGAGIGGGGGAYDASGAGSSSGLISDAGTVSGIGGAGGYSGGGGAGIGGGGGGYYTGSAGNGSGVTTDGGTVNGTGGAGGSFAGGGAGVGGGGAAYDAGGAGTGSGVTTDTGILTGIGGAGGSYAGGGAGIGGGGGGYFTGSGGSGSGVAIDGGTVVGNIGGGGTNASGGSGIGGGGGGYLGSGDGSSGSVTIDQGSSASLYGEVAASLTVDTGATLAVPGEQTLTLDGSDSNSGTIALAGILDGAGTLTNSGSITVSGNAWSVAGNGPGAAGSGPSLTGNAYQLQFSVPSGDTVPADLWVYASTVAASGQSLPSVPSRAGYTATGWQVAGAIVSPTAALAGMSVNGLVSLDAAYSPVAPTITYSLASSTPKSATGWYRSPVTVTFTCEALSGATLTSVCPGPITLSSNGAGQSVSEQITASNGESASTIATGIDIDQTEPTVKIAGPRSHKTYRRIAPAPRCEASDAVSGIATCKLAVRRTKTTRGYRETITALATSNAGSTNTVRLSFTVRVPRKR
jgi:hypothetical protein